MAGLSLGALITQELALARPDLVRAAVMMGTVGRSSAMLRGWLEGTLDLIEQGIVLPPRFDAAMLAMQVVGPRHQRDDAFIGPWLELVAAVPPWEGPGRQGQYAADLAYDDRLGALAGVTVPSLVIGFEHDLITPATMCRRGCRRHPGRPVRGGAGVRASRTFRGPQDRRAPAARVLRGGLSCGRW